MHKNARSTKLLSFSSLGSRRLFLQNIQFIQFCKGESVIRFTELETTKRSRYVVTIIAITKSYNKLLQKPLGDQRRSCNFIGTHQDISLNLQVRKTETYRKRQPK